jgi:hypothetical protein
MNANDYPVATGRTPMPEWRQHCGFHFDHRVLNGLQPGNLLFVRDQLCEGRRVLSFLIVPGTVEYTREGLEVTVGVDGGRAAMDPEWILAASHP